jgi:hypothetical protein
MKRRRSVFVGYTPASNSVAVRLNNEYIESVESLNQFQAFNGSTLLTGFIVDVGVRFIPLNDDIAPGTTFSNPVFNVNEAEAAFLLCRLRDNKPGFHLVDVEKTKTLPDTFDLVTIGKSDPTMNISFPNPIILRLNVVEKD